MYFEKTKLMYLYVLYVPSDINKTLSPEISHALYLMSPTSLLHANYQRAIKNIDVNCSIIKILTNIK